MPAAVRTMRPFFQSREIVRIVPPPPAVEGLPADTEMAAGKGGIPTVLEIMGHPLQPENPGSAQLAPQARQLARLGNLPGSNLHCDTLYRVSLIILNEHRG